MKLLLLLLYIFKLLNCFPNTNDLIVKSMNFNIKKNSLWLSYPINKKSFNKICCNIPQSHKLIKSKIFEEDKFDYRLYFNLFEVKTTFFSGDRLEILTIAQDKNNKINSFIILDCFTNVLSWNPNDGIYKSNSKIFKEITNFKYNILIKNNNNDILFYLKSTKSKIKKRVLTEFSIKPNYIFYFNNNEKGYRLVFNEKQLDKKVIILDNIKLKNDIYAEYINELEYGFIYPQGMDFKVLL